MYLIPGLSSIIMQVLIGAAIAIPILVGIFRGQVKTFFSRSWFGGRKKH